MGKNKPKSKFSPKSIRKPKIDPNIPNILDQNPAWHIQKLDKDGKWGWINVTKEDILHKIMPKMGNFERMKWKEILGSNNHEISVEKISKDAKKRLNELKLYDIETLISLRLSSRERVWGIKIANVLNISKELLIIVLGLPS